MSGSAAAVLLAAAALLSAAPSRRGATRRVMLLTADAEVAPRSSAPRAVGGATAPQVRLLGAGGAFALTFVLIGGAGVLVAGLGSIAVAASVWWGVALLEPAARRRARERAVRDLPFAVDLFASCVAAGASTADALRLTGEGIGGPVGAAFTRASATLVLGAPTAEAVAVWSRDPVLEPLRPVARLLVRSATSGTELVPATTRLASDLRESRRWQVDEVARRVGVRATAPLGACFLPAFVLLGIVPLVVAGGRAIGG